MTYLTTVGPSDTPALWHDVADNVAAFGDSLGKLYAKTGIKESHWKTPVSKAVAEIFQTPIAEYLPKEGDSLDEVAKNLGVANSSLKINLFGVPVGQVMKFDGRYVTIVREGSRATVFPATAAKAKSFTKAA